MTRGAYGATLQLFNDRANILLLTRCSAMITNHQAEKGQASCEDIVWAQRWHFHDTLRDLLNFLRELVNLSNAT